MAVSVDLNVKYARMCRKVVLISEKDEKSKSKSCSATLSLSIAIFLAERAKR